MFKDVNIDRWIEPRYNHAPIKIQKERWMIKSNFKKDDLQISLTTIKKRTQGKKMVQSNTWLKRDQISYVWFTAGGQVFKKFTINDIII